MDSVRMAGVFECGHWGKNWSPERFSHLPTMPWWLLRAPGLSPATFERHIGLWLTSWKLLECPNYIYNHLTTEVSLGDRKALSTEYQAHRNKEQSLRGRAISEPISFSLSLGMGFPMDTTCGLVPLPELHLPGPERPLNCRLRAMDPLNLCLLLWLCSVLTVTGQPFLLIPLYTTPCYTLGSCQHFTSFIAIIILPGDINDLLICHINIGFSSTITQAYIVQGLNSDLLVHIPRARKYPNWI